mmetsp:Transcript_10433/g.43136  ORF Transcript_10433/g.43136 Transcript_10433/m.43136 type:complete len:204 (-) Transcript_10433:438-1049(-)
MEVPAALAKALRLAVGEDDNRLLGMRLADLVALIVLAEAAQVGVRAADNLARDGRRPFRALGSRPGGVLVGVRARLLAGGAALLGDRQRQLRRALLLLAAAVDLLRRRLGGLALLGGGAAAAAHLEPACGRPRGRAQKKGCFRRRCGYARKGGRGKHWRDRHDRLERVRRPLGRRSGDGGGGGAGLPPSRERGVPAANSAQRA